MWYKLKRILIYPDGVTEKQVRPKYEWKPWDNTLLYLPLESDTNDYSWNSRNWTPTSVTFTTVGWVPSAHVDTSGKIALPVWFISASESKATVSFLYYVWSTTTSARRTFMEFRNIYTTCSIQINANTTNVSWGYIWDQLSAANTAQKRNHIVITWDINWINMYMNWSLVSTMTGSATPRRNSTQTDYNVQYVMNGRDGDKWVNWNMREYILENIKRSAEDVSKYYQRIKSKLWI